RSASKPPAEELAASESASDRYGGAADLAPRADRPRDDRVVPRPVGHPEADGERPRAHARAPRRLPDEPPLVHEGHGPPRPVPRRSDVELHPQQALVLCPDTE